MHEAILPPLSLLPVPASSPMADARARLAMAGIIVKPAVVPVANYVPCVSSPGTLLHVSGQGTRRDGVFQFVGTVGSDFTVEQGYEAARLCGLNLLAQLEAFCGLEQVCRVVKLSGFVNATPSFTDLPAIVDGASDLLELAFGGQGHARSVAGVPALPFGMAVEVEGVFEIQKPHQVEHKSVRAESD